MKSHHSFLSTTTTKIIIILFLALILNLGSAQCGNGQLQTPSEACDDGNIINYDGCSSACIVQNNYLCTNNSMVLSVCRISTIVNLTFVGVQRDTTDNAAVLYFTLNPYFSAYLSINFNGLLANAIKTTSMTIVYINSQNLLKVSIHYTENIQNTYQQFSLLLNNTGLFWNPSNSTNIYLKGVNSELTYDTNLWMHNIMQYIILLLVGVSIIAFLVSILFQKWIGLELIQTYQSVFFILSLMSQYPFQFSALYQNIRFANGYDDILESDYYRTYTLSKQLNALSMEKQFISNFNINFIIICLFFVVLLVLGFIKRHYRLMLQEQVLQHFSKKQQKINKIYSFVFGRVFIMVVFFSMFKIIFSFCVQLSHQFSIVQIFADQFNISIGMIAFIVVFGIIAFVLYWYLLLPSSYSQDQQFMSLRFQNMQFSYPLMYIAYQSLFIAIISIFYHKRSITIFVILGLQSIYLFLIICIRPYNTIRQINKILHNSSIIFNQITTVVTTGIVIRWNSILDSSYQTDSHIQLSVLFFLLLLLLSMATILTIIRLIIFNKDVTCNCCKKQVNQMQEINYKSMKNILEQEMKSIGCKVDDQKVMPINMKVNNYESVKRRQSINKADDEFIDKNMQIDKYLNDKYINWAKNQNVETKQYKHIKKSTNKKKAEYIKSSLEQFIQIQKLRYEKNMT